MKVIKFLGFPIYYFVVFIYICICMCENIKIWNDTKTFGTTLKFLEFAEY